MRAGLGIPVALVVVGCSLLSPGFDPEPIPIPAKYAEVARGLLPVDGSWPPPLVTADEAHSIAVEAFVQHLRGNRMPVEGTSPIGLVRRLSPGGEDGGASTTVWVVVYRAAFKCLNKAGGPGPCDDVTAFFIDDQTGEEHGSSGITYGP